MSVNTTDPMIGRLIDGRYQVRSRIARGGMATVYLATDLRLERRVAVKVMHGHLSDDSQFKQRFIQEARSAARLAHPNVVNVFDQGQDSDSAYLVMEYLPGITLRELLEEYGRLTPEQTIDIAEAVLSGLAAAHKAGIVHRDLKPENVLLADDGRIKIGDFGLARAATANTATGAALLGTIAYLSPELVTRGIADTRSDIYAVGIMMYEMLTGEQPFTGEQPMQIAYRHANEPLPPPSDANPAVPPELDELVLWATAKDPEVRPADARVLLDQVHDAEASIGRPDAPTAPQKTVVLPTARPLAPSRPHADDETQVLGTRRSMRTTAPTDPGNALAIAEPAPPAPPRRRRRWIPLLAGLVVLLLAGGVGWWFLWGPGARVTIPEDLSGKSVEDVRLLLEEIGFTVLEETGEAHSPTAPAGSVAETDPAMGSSLAPGTEVQILVSLGPEMLEIDLNAGMTQAQAEAVVNEHWTLDGIQERFHPEIPAGQLVDAYDAEGRSLLEATEYGELQGITLDISVGPLPPVRGMTVEEAVDELERVGLQGQTREPEFSDEIEADRVIGIVTVDADGEALVVRPGDLLVLRLSKGPDYVEYPADILSMTLADAKAALEELGFTVEVRSALPEMLWDEDFARVGSVEPERRAVRGSPVIIRGRF